MTPKSLKEDLRNLADTGYARATLIVRFNQPTGKLDWKPMDASVSLSDKLREAAAAIEALEQKVQDLEDRADSEWIDQQRFSE